MRKIIFIAGYCFLPGIIQCQNNIYSTHPFPYPESKKETFVDTFFGQEIIDNYRWLENDTNAETMRWVDYQNNFTENYFKEVRCRRKVKRRLEYYSTISVPHIRKQGKYYFSFHSESMNSTPALFYRKKLTPEKTKLIDPATISKSDNISILEYHTSKNSDYLAFAYSRNGHELKEVNVISLPEGEKLDHITNFSYPDISWQRDGIAWRGNGFFYSRIGKPGEKVDLHAENTQQYIYYHKIGTSEKYDSLVFMRENNPEIFFNLYTTTDERYFILIEVNNKTQRSTIYIDDFRDNINGLKVFVRDFDKSIKFIDNINSELIALTNYNANHNQLVAIDPNSSMKWELIIPKIKDALLLDAMIAGEKIIGIYESLINHEQLLIVFDFEGKIVFKQNVGDGINIGGLMGGKEDNELLMYFESYVKPPIYTIFDVSQNKFTLHIKIDLGGKFNYNDYSTEVLKYKSKDGTDIPITIVKNKKKFQPDGNNVTILTAYGGFGKVVPAHFNPDLVFFLEKGGVYAFAHIRGGGELGDNWYLQGKGLNRRNSVDDFLGAAEYLISNHFTKPSKLAIIGSSFGGFIAGAALAKRPELFKVAVLKVALLDLLNSHEESNEFGSMRDTIAFNSRLELSPFHNIVSDSLYPAIMLCTGENDERVPPFHALKYAAAMQSIKSNKNPIIIKITKKSGHFGIWKYSAWLEENADIYSFIFHNMEIKF